MPIGSKQRNPGLGRIVFALGLALSTGCVRGNPPLPSFSREHQKTARSAPERQQNMLELAERCVDATRNDLTRAQMLDRARLLCRQAARPYPLQDSAMTSALDPLPTKLDKLRQTLATPTPSAASRQSEIEALEQTLDRLHAHNDPQLLAALQRSAPRWHLSGTKLWLSLRRWRRCQERSPGTCKSEASRCQADLQGFEQALSKLVAAQPFGARSFRRCAERSLLPQPPQARGIAQVAPDAPESLRSCERMAARIRWMPI